VGLVFSFGLNPDFGYLTWTLKAMVSRRQTLCWPRYDRLGGADRCRRMGVGAVRRLDGLAGLRALPVSPIEAAAIDGCSSVQLYTQVIPPMLRPVWVSRCCSARLRPVREFDKVYSSPAGTG